MVLHSGGPPPPWGGWELYRVVELVGGGSVINGATPSSSRHFWVFAFWMIFSVFQKKSGFGVFLVHPPMASVLLSASVERCFVSRMRDFLYQKLQIAQLQCTNKSFMCRNEVRIRSLCLVLWLLPSQLAWTPLGIGTRYISMLVKLFRIRKSLRKCNK